MIQSNFTFTNTTPTESNLQTTENDTTKSQIQSAINASINDRYVTPGNDNANAANTNTNSTTTTSNTSNPFEMLETTTNLTTATPATPQKQKMEISNSGDDTDIGSFSDTPEKSVSNHGMKKQRHTSTNPTKKSESNPFTKVLERQQKRKDQISNILRPITSTTNNSKPKPKHKEIRNLLPDFENAANDEHMTKKYFKSFPKDHIAHTGHYPQISQSTVMCPEYNASYPYDRDSEGRMNFLKLIADRRTPDNLCMLGFTDLIAESETDLSDPARYQRTIAGSQMTTANIPTIESKSGAVFLQLGNIRTSDTRVNMTRETGQGMTITNAFQAKKPAILRANPNLNPRIEKNKILTEWNNSKKTIKEETNDRKRLQSTVRPNSYFDITPEGMLLTRGYLTMDNGAYLKKISQEIYQSSLKNAYPTMWGIPQPHSLRIYSPTLHRRLEQKNWRNLVNFVGEIIAGLPAHNPLCQMNPDNLRFRIVDAAQHKAILIIPRKIGGKEECKIRDTNWAQLQRDSKFEQRRLSFQVYPPFIDHARQKMTVWNLPPEYRTYKAIKSKLFKQINAQFSNIILLNLILELIEVNLDHRKVSWPRIYYRVFGVKNIIYDIGYQKWTNAELEQKLLDEVNEHNSKNYEMSEKLRALQDYVREQYQKGEIDPNKIPNDLYQKIKDTLWCFKAMTPDMTAQPMYKKTQSWIILQCAALANSHKFYMIQTPPFMTEQQYRKCLSQICPLRLRNIHQTQYYMIGTTPQCHTSFTFTGISALLIGGDAGLNIPAMEIHLNGKQYVISPYVSHPIVSAIWQLSRQTGACGIVGHCQVGSPCPERDYWKKEYYQTKVNNSACFGCGDFTHRVKECETKPLSIIMCTSGLTSGHKRCWNPQKHMYAATLLAHGKKLYEINELYQGNIDVNMLNNKLLLSYDLRTLSPKVNPTFLYDAAKRKSTKLMIYGIASTTLSNSKKRPNTWDKMQANQTEQKIDSDRKSREKRRQNFEQRIEEKFGKDNGLLAFMTSDTGTDYRQQMNDQMQKMTVNTPVTAIIPSKSENYDTITEIDNGNDNDNSVISPGMSRYQKTFTIQRKESDKMEENDTPHIPTSDLTEQQSKSAKIKLNQKIKMRKNATNEKYGQTSLNLPDLTNGRLRQFQSGKATKPANPMTHGQNRRKQRQSNTMDRQKSITDQNKQNLNKETESERKTKESQI